MPNQMIALGARAPNVDPLGGAIRNNAAMISMMAQQQALQRQNAIAEQTMQIQRAQEARAGAKEGREITSAQVELAKNVAANFKEELNFLAPGDVQGATALRNSVVQTIPGWNAILPPPETIANDPTTRRRLLMKVDEIIAYTVPKPTASVQVNPDTNALQAVTVGGLETPSAKEIPEFRFVPNAPSAPPMAAPAQSDQNAGAILRSAATTGTITADEAARVQSSLGPNGGAKFNGWLQQNGIQIVPSRGGGIPVQRSAAPQSGYESKMMDDGMGGYEPTGRVARGKSPMQSPMPGSAAVPLKRVRAEAQAESAGRTAGATKSPAQLEAESYASKKGELRATQEKKQRRRRRRR